jgi:hypothetical protein
MTIDPDPLAERSSDGLTRDDLKMDKYDDSKQSLEENADIDPKLKEKFDL